MTTTTDQAVAISTADFRSEYGAPLLVGVGETPMLAQCPKDTIWAHIAGLEVDGEIEAGDAELRILCHGVFGRENGDQALAMLDDPGNRDVTMESLGGLLGYCMEQWGPEVQAHFEQLHASKGNRAQRRVIAKKTTTTARKPGAPKTAAARKTAAAKTPAKKAAAAKGRR